MKVEARRVFRLGLTTALALAIAYGLALPLPYLAPMFALMLTAPPAPPIGLKGLAGLILLVLLTLGIGLLLTPMLMRYPVAAVLIVGVGVHFSMYLTVNRAKGLVGSLLTVGFTMIPAAGSVDFALALIVIQALVLGIGLAIVCQWVVYPWFPEDAMAARAPQSAPADAEQSTWIALRAALIVLPPFLLALTNPSMYLPLIMKSVLLGQQGSIGDARRAGFEMLGSTFLAGCFAILFWMLLGTMTNLWMFFWWMLLFAGYFAAKLYQVLASRFTSSFWQNVAVTMLILLGSAVQDSANGKDVYAAFAVRMSLFIGVAVYAWAAIALLEHLRARRLKRLSPGPTLLGTR